MCADLEELSLISYRNYIALFMLQCGEWRILPKAEICHLQRKNYKMMSKLYRYESLTKDAMDNDTERAEPTSEEAFAKDAEDSVGEEDFVEAAKLGNLLLDK